MDVEDFTGFTLRLLSPGETAGDPEQRVEISILAMPEGGTSRTATRFKFVTTSAGLARLLAQGRAVQTSLAVTRRREAEDADEVLAAKVALTQSLPPTEELLRRVIHSLRDQAASPA